MTEHKPEYKLFPIKDIKIGSGRRPLSGQVVQDLMVSIKNIGLQNPIGINADDQTLVTGRHRLEAYKKLKFTTIPALVRSYSKYDAQITEIEENLTRNDLTSMERVMFEARRDKLVKDRVSTPSMHKLAQVQRAETTRKDLQVLKKDIKLGEQLIEKLPEKVQELIRDTKIADNKVQLEKLIQHDPENQLEIAKRIKNKGAKNVEDAVRRINSETGHSGSPKHDEQSDAAKFMRLFEKISPQSRKFLEKDCMSRLLRIWDEDRMMEARDIVQDLRDVCTKLIDKISDKLD